MTDTIGTPTLGEAARLYIAQLPAKIGGAAQPEISRFVRWYGSDTRISGLTGQSIASYGERLSPSDADYDKRLKNIKAFLAHIKKRDWSAVNLSLHLKVKKVRASVSGGRHGREKVSLTAEGMAELKAELAALKQRSLELVDAIRKAAADKDFRENAPLYAAREERGHVEGRIMELGETLKAAVVIDGSEKQQSTAGIGNRVTLRDTASGADIQYFLVHPREVDPAKGKISSESPLGRAILGHGPGDTVEMTAPAGTVSYTVVGVE